jgi:predicted RNase H-like HicB family nuclease
MQYQVLVQNLPDGLFSGIVVGLPDIVAKGASEDEVLNNARSLLKERLAVAKLFTIEVEESMPKLAANPLLELYGTLRDDSTFDDWMDEIAQYRQELEAEEMQREFASA